MAARKPTRTARAMPLPDLVALVLQGGGALGAYQAGVYEALLEHGIEIDWVAGISIGAVNAAIIAGNKPEDVVPRLRQFWELVSSGLPALPQFGGDAVREWTHLAAAGFVTSFGVPGFFRPNFVPALLAPHGSREAISNYDTAPLIETLDSLIDWQRANNGPIRLAVGAVEITSGNFHYFDTVRDKIDARHILASGALPPGLPPVEIDGVHYWDGGLVSNTPLSYVVEDCRQDMLVFQVDLFPARGVMPRHMEDVWSREKDIRYSSRTRQISDQLIRRRQEHQRIDRMLSKLPLECFELPEVKAVQQMVNCKALNLVQLIHRPPVWQTGARDFEFSRDTMETNWELGRQAVKETISHGELIAENIHAGRTDSFDLLR